MMLLCNVINVDGEKVVILCLNKRFILLFKKQSVIHFLKTSRFICFAILSSAATGISFILQEVSGVNQRKSSLVENVQHV